MNEDKNLLTADPQVIQFLQNLWLAEGLSVNTQKSYELDLKALQLYCAQRDQTLNQVSGEQLASYLRDRQSSGLSSRSLARQIATFRKFYSFLYQEHLIETNPALGLETPKLNQTLPHVLSEEAVALLLAAPCTDDSLGLRDRAMLETLYGTGLRVTELVCLPKAAVHFHAGWIRVEGKGAKERLIPFGESVRYWLNRYLEARSIHAETSEHLKYLFLSERGRPMTRQAFWYRIKLYVKQVGCDPGVSPHTLRHAFATHLVNHDADLRAVQMMLGHTHLTTTQIYTHVAQHRLKQLHAQHHPRG